MKLFDPRRADRTRSKLGLTPATAQLRVLEDLLEEQQETNALLERLCEITSGEKPEESDD